MTVPAPRTAAPADPLVTGFWVKVDGIELPSFTECQGLGAEYEVVTWEEGGRNDRAHKLPGRLTYSPLTLTRRIDSASGALAAWFGSVLDRAKPFRTAVVSACGPDGKPVAHWDLVDVWPSRYTGPSFSAGGNSALTESVELIHHGFTLAFDPPARG